MGKILRRIFRSLTSFLAKKDKKDRVLSISGGNDKNKSGGRNNLSKQDQQIIMLMKLQLKLLEKMFDQVEMLIKKYRRTNQGVSTIRHTYELQMDLRSLRSKTTIALKKDLNGMYEKIKEESK